MKHEVLILRHELGTFVIDHDSEDIEGVEHWCRRKKLDTQRMIVEDDVATDAADGVAKILSGVRVTVYSPIR